MLKYEKRLFQIALKFPAYYNKNAFIYCLLFKNPFYLWQRINNQGSPLAFNPLWRI